MAYGVGTDYAHDEVGQVVRDPSAVATPVRQLLEATTPTPGAKLGIMPRADIDAWEGDVEELRGHEDSLTSDNDLW